MRASSRAAGLLVVTALVVGCADGPVGPGAPSASAASGWNRLPAGAPVGRAVLGPLAVAAAVTNGAFANGSFEEPGYAGWTLWEGPFVSPTSGTWGLAGDGQTIAAGAGVFDHFDQILVFQGSPGLPHTYSATDGDSVALQLQNGSQFHRMYQDITLPVGATTISWDMEYTNHSGAFVPTQQEMQVNVRDPNTDAVLANLYTTTQGVDPQSIPMTHFTADVSAFGGQTVRISVDHMVNNFYFDAAWDNFRVDFVVATDKDQCKNGGWADVRRADGSTFKNQGDCIQYVNTGK